MSETIQKIDLNFSNAGGGHTASVTTLLNAKNLDGSDGLGTVVGDLGELNSFSNEKIGEMMTNFVCTQHSIGADPTKKTISRKYVDRTSLILKSHVVMVRGINCGPETLNFEGPIPYFTEVINSPLKSFKSQGPTLDQSGSIIMLGRIYNYESAAKFDGLKITLVYQNKELKPELSLNDEFVSETYKGAPDLSQYDLKYGYTVKEFKEALSMVGINLVGLPDSEDILFENTGTLDSILGAIASFFGYFWFVNPANGSVQFINTEQASSINIIDHTDTTDESITSASFTKAKTTGKLVNAYIGSAEKPEKKSPKDDFRGRKASFKRVFPEKAKGFKLSEFTLGIFYFLFNQGRVNTDIFDKYTYFLAYAMEDFNPPEGGQERSLLEQRFGDRAARISFADLYTDQPKSGDVIKFGPKKNKKEQGRFIFPLDKQADEHRKTEIEFRGIKFDRIRDKFEYINLASRKNKNVGMIKPSETKLYEFLESYFEFAGGIFISNGYSKYKADRMDFSNSNTLNIVGPFKSNKFLEDIDELSELDDLFKKLGMPRMTIGRLADASNGRAKTVNPFHFVGLRAVKKRELNKDDDAVDFRYLQNLVELKEFENSTYKLVMGGPTQTEGKMVPFTAKGLLTILMRYATQSRKNFDNATNKQKKQLKVEYDRGKTRVNQTTEDGEDAEDDAISESSSGDQQISDLFDRFDLKSFDVQAPAHSITNQLSIFAASGNVTEMRALKSQRGNYANAVDVPKSSSRTIYGLEIPTFNPTINSLSISVGPQGITTTINESTIKLIPPDQELLTDRGMDTSVRKSYISSVFTASQRNVMGL